VLLAFGAGIGLSAVSPWSNSGISATTFNIGAGVYLCITAVMASSIGGYLAGRLRTKWVGVHTHEVYFRDTAHGFLAWAFATVLSVAVLASAAANIVGGAAAGLAQPNGSTAGQSDGPMAGFVDLLLRANPPITRSDASDVANARGELDRLFSSHLRPPRYCSELSPRALLPQKEGGFATGPGSTRSRHVRTIKPT